MIILCVKKVYMRDFFKIDMDHIDQTISNPWQYERPEYSYNNKYSIFS